MHFFGDFEAINNQIVAAAFVSEDGSREEHWLMKPHRRFKGLEGFYAELLPYKNEDFADAPLLQNCPGRFQRIIGQAERLWFFDRSDLKFFEDSYRNEPQLISSFRHRYADAKPLVEEVLTPIYVRNTVNGQYINLRALVSYLEMEPLNVGQADELYEDINYNLHALLQIMQDKRRPLEQIMSRFARFSFDNSSTHHQPTWGYMKDVLDQACFSLQRQQLLSRDAVKNMRWLRSRCSYLSTLPHAPVRILRGMIALSDEILATQGKRLTNGKLSIPMVEELIQKQNLPLEIIDLFPESKLDRQRCLEILDRSIGLRTAASLLLSEEELSLEGDVHNALYDTQLLRLVCLKCFERLRQLQPYVGGVSALAFVGGG